MLCLGSTALEILSLFQDRNALQDGLSLLDGNSAGDGVGIARLVVMPDNNDGVETFSFWEGG